jgi:hypothetical protein
MVRRFSWALGRDVLIVETRNFLKLMVLSAPMKI